MADLSDLTSPDAPAWSGMRKAQRDRMAAACRHLAETKTIQRADIMRLGEVNIATASTDLKAMQKRVPELLTYDAAARCYRLAEAAAS